MYQACLEQTGLELYLVSGYRSYSAQTKSYNRALSRKGLVHTIKYYAWPGRSEHQLGLGFDISTADKREISAHFAERPAGQWLAAHAYLYGFILRYPAGKESLTGYGYEAWHYRYVGVDLATICYQNNWVLEEYWQAMGG